MAAVAPSRVPVDRSGDEVDSLSKGAALGVLILEITSSPAWVSWKASLRPLPPTGAGPSRDSGLVRNGLRRPAGSARGAGQGGLLAKVARGFATNTCWRSPGCVVRPHARGRMIASGGGICAISRKSTSTAEPIVRESTAGPPRKDDRRWVRLCLPVKAAGGTATPHTPSGRPSWEEHRPARRGDYLTEDLLENAVPPESPCVRDARLRRRLGGSRRMAVEPIRRAYPATPPASLSRKSVFAAAATAAAAKA